MQVDNVSSITTDLIRRDSGIPGLALLLDPARLLTKLCSQLDTTRVEDIKLVYLRYKPGMNCLARYELCAGERIISAYAKAHGEDAAGKISKSIERDAIDGSLGPGRVVLDDSQLIFSTFPNDTKLASLRCLSDMAFRQRLFLRLFGSNSQWHDSTIAELLNYKPERRYVARLTRADGQSALVKFHSRSGYAKARTISRRLGAARADFYPRTIGRSKKHAVVAYSWQAGTTLRQLSTEGNLVLSDLAATAESLAEFHASSTGGLVAIETGERARRLSALADQLGFLIPQLRQRAQDVAQKMADWFDSQVSVIRPVHGDFYDKQAIVHDNTVRLIDLDAARLDNPLLDLGNYLAHLEKQVLVHGLAAAEAEAQKETLISVYEGLTGTIYVNNLKKYTALGLFDLIHQPFRDWAHDWPEQTEQLLARVEHLLAG